jgi:energy-coupling factor transporter ATP-binding protein EcfA2
VSDAAVLEARAACYRYAGRSVFVGPFDLRVRAGDLHLIGGASGCGKSTLARVLTGLIPHLYRGALHGQVRIDGRRSDEQPLWSLAMAAGLVSQNPAAQLLATTVRGEVVFGLENLGLERSEIEVRTERALMEFDLRGLAERDPRTLSGGEQQKLVLAAIVARRPRALVLDEPLSMLDSGSAAEVVGHLERLRAAGTALVVFEHRSRLFARLCGVQRTRLPGSERPDGGALPDPPPRLGTFRLRTRDLRVGLGGAAVLDGVDLALEGGTVVAVVGANGAGKTTLLRALAGLQAVEGSVETEGAGGVGLCFQNPDRQLFNATVREEILYGMPPEGERLYGQVVSLLGLGRYERSAPLLLSEGEKRRLALATLLVRPGLSGFCLDEPTLGQDEDHAAIVGRVARWLAASGRLCVVATHDLGWAAQWCDEVLLLDRGRIAARERPQSMLERIRIRARPGLRLPESCEGTCKVQPI